MHVTPDRVQALCAAREPHKADYLVLFAIKGGILLKG